MRADARDEAFNTATIRAYFSPTMKHRSWFEGWTLVGLTAVVVGALAGLILGVVGANETGLRMLIRATARVSFVLFTTAFIASSVNRLWPTPLSKWMLRNRRYIGVSFATSHGVHLLAILAAARVIVDFHIDAVTLTGGALGYMLIAAMVATSFDRSARWLGHRWWTRLHKVGVYYMWGIFAFDYVGRATVSLAFVPLAAIVLGALALRIAASRPRVDVVVARATTT